jgi:hypothetical protein
MRSQIHKRALRWMPPIVGAAVGIGATCVLASVRGVGQGPGALMFRMMDFGISRVANVTTVAAAPPDTAITANDAFGDLTLGVGFLIQAALFVGLLVRMLGLLHATEERQLPEVAILVAEQKGVVRATVGEQRAASLAQCCFPGDVPAYYLQGGGYYQVPVGVAYDRYMSCMSLLLVSMGLIQQITTLVALLRGAIGLAIALNVILGCGNGPVLVGIMYARPVRKRIQAWLLRLGGRGMERAAATVAGLMGTRDPQQVLASAKSTFRGLHSSAIGLEDLGTSADTGLNEKVFAIKLGQCDAFISHSWHDDGAAKYAALASWASAFENEHHRLPVVWLDKASINQDDIEASLACLPVYLAGCKTLLVLAGPTCAPQPPARSLP